MDTILHSDDINLLEYWKRILDKKCIIKDDIEELFDFENSFFIINFTALGVDYKKVIEKFQSKNNIILLLDRTANIEKAKAFLKLGIKGYGNALMKEHFIISAVKTIRDDGMIWLYPGFISELIKEIDSSNKSEKINLDILTKREKEVASLLKNGLTYKDIATKLNVKSRTIKAHAKHIYTKLGVKDRLALALLIK
jgi:DNA-binding NarL/FixJ family response regulator